MVEIPTLEQIQLWSSGGEFTPAPSPAAPPAAPLWPPAASASTGTITQYPFQEQPYPAAPPVTTGGTPNVAAWEAAMNALNAQNQLIGRQEATLALAPQALAAGRAVADASAAELAARSRVVEMTPQLIAADRAVASAQKKELTARESELSLQQRIMEERLAEEIAIQAAKENTEDILKVARAQRTRDSLAYRFTIAGLPQPIEVQLPPDFEGPLPPGLVPRLMTLAQILTEAARDKDKLRAFDIEAARILTLERGLDVSAAQIRRGDVKLTIDEAELAVARAGLATASARINAERVNLLLQQAEIFERQAGLAVSRATLATRTAELPPAPGLVWDELTGGWTTPAAIRARTELSESQLVSMFASHALESEEELRSRLNAMGLLPRTVELWVAQARVARQRADEEGTGVGLPPRPGGGIQLPAGESSNFNSFPQFGATLGAALGANFAGPVVPFQ